MNIWRAKYESRNYEFEAYADTKKDALSTLLKGLTAHAKEFDLDTNWCWYDKGDITNTQYTLGNAYRYGLDGPLYTSEENDDED